MFVDWETHSLCGEVSLASKTSLHRFEVNQTRVVSVRPHQSLTRSFTHTCMDLLMYDPVVAALRQDRQRHRDIGYRTQRSINQNRHHFAFGAYGTTDILLLVCAGKVGRTPRRLRPTMIKVDNQGTPLCTVFTPLPASQGPFLVYLYSKKLIRRAYLQAQSMESVERSTRRSSIIVDRDRISPHMVNRLPF